MIGFWTPGLALAEPPSEAQIRDARKQHDAATTRHDLAALSKLTTAEVQTTGPVWRATGIADLRAKLARLIEKRPDVDMTYEAEAIEVNEAIHVASERGRWRETWTEKGGPVEMRGGYFAMWKRIDGKWLLDACLVVPQSCKGDTYCKPK